MYHPQSGQPPPGLGGAHSGGAPPSARMAASRAIPIVAPGSSPSAVNASLAGASSTSSGLDVGSSGTATGPSPRLKAAQTSVSSSSTPSSPMRGALSARAATAAVFVPKSATTVAPIHAASSAHSEPDTDASLAAAAAKLSTASSGQQRSFNPYAQAHVPQLAGGTESGRGTPNSAGQWEGDGMNSMFDPTYMGPLPGTSDTSAVQTPSAPLQRAFNPYEHMDAYGNGPGGDVFDAGRGAVAIRAPQPLNYALHTAPLPHVSNLHPHHLSAHAFFLSPTQREELARRNDAVHAAVLPPEQGGPNLPEELHVYHSLVPLEASHGSSLTPALIDPRVAPPTAMGSSLHLSGAAAEPSRVFGFRSTAYKALCTLDGKAYVLRRLEGFRLQHEAAIGLVERWRRIRHPSIVSVREAFTTRAFGDQSIVFVYDYHPLSTTLYGEHLVPKPPQLDRRTGRLQPVSMQIPERTLWSYTVQLTSVLRCIHGHGLAARCVEPSKVLRTGKNRVRINCCSIFDVIAHDPRAAPSTVATQQGEDLLNLGKLLVSLSCNSMAAVQNLPKSLEQIARLYSAEFKTLVLWLLGKPTPAKTADELGRLLGTHVADEFDSALNYSDLLESGLSKELENARLVRLLCKFGFINERPEFDHDPRWSETGDRYIVKLFRDHVFHAVDEAGRPVVDLSHILTNLNKLDAGSDEKIMLTSRDEQSCLVLSYREIKNCVESAFQDLSRAR